MPLFLKLHESILSMSIRTKLFLAMIIVGVGVTTGVTYFAIDQQKKSIELDVKKAGDFIASSVADHIAEQLLQGQYLEIREILGGIKRKDSRILYITVNDMTTPRKEVVAVVGDEKWVPVTQNIFDSRRETLDGVEQYIFFQDVTITGVAKMIGMVRIGMSLHFMHERLEETRDSMMVLMTAAIALSLVLALIISNAVLKPLRSLTSGILKIAGGQFSHRIVVESRDETGVLARTFNRMTENLTILQEISGILNEQAGPQEVLSAVLNRLAKNIAGKTGALLFHGVDGEEFVAGDADETSIVFLRKLRSEPHPEGAPHPKPYGETYRLCFPFFSEGEITGGIWMVRPEHTKIDDIDERLLNGVSDQLETTLSKLEFQYRAVTDALTGLYNHRYFQQEINRQIEKALRLDRPFTLIMSDLDHFKQVNDTYGHQQGDTVLKAVSGAIKKSIRGKVDVACRYGGEEFAIILPETPLEGAKIFAERFRKAVEELQFDFDGKSAKCTISIGLATYPEAAADKRLLIERADRALYVAKESGRNSIKTYKDI